MLGTKKIVLYIVALLLPVCMVSQSNPAAWPDQLNLKYTPSSAFDQPEGFMSDLGAWFGFGLPAEDHTERYGAFSGPWLMNGKSGWISDGLVQFTLTDETGITEIRPVEFEAHSFPGRLEQSMKFGNILMRSELVFASASTALIRVILINPGKETEKVVPVWKGRLFGNTMKATIRENGIWLSDKPESRILTVHVTKGGEPLVINDSVFSFSNKPLTLEPKGFASYYLAVSSFGNTDEISLGMSTVNEVLGNPDAVFDKNMVRWKGYLESAFKSLKSSPDSMAAPGIVVKSIQTLIGNWRAKMGTLPHDGIFPSSYYTGYYGFWAWDSWKQAAACAWFNPELARSQVRLMFSRQDTSGMVPDVIYPDPSGDNYRNTKPPLSAWAVNEIYNATSDVAFVRELLPALLRYHAWWFRFRDADRNGLCSWGSADNTLEASRWESGMDNAVRFDQAELVQSGDHAWCMTQESPDLNGYLYAEKMILARLCEVTGRDDEAAILRTGAGKLKKLINDVLWDESEGFYKDRFSGKGRFTEVIGPEGWIPLWAGVPDSSRAVLVTNSIIDPTLFRTLMPFPTFPARISGFDPVKGYWRGPVWLDQAFFALSGLRRYEIRTTADELQHQLLTAQNGISEKGVPLYETYNPLTAGGQNAPNFSWSAAHLLLMLMQR